jgi:hypothetical protein
MAQLANFDNIGEIWSAADSALSDLDRTGLAQLDLEEFPIGAGECPAN